MMRPRPQAVLGSLAFMSGWIVGSAAAETNIRSGFNPCSVDQDREMGQQFATNAERELPILSRTEEKEADTVRARMLARPGCGPMDMVAFLQGLEATEDHVVHAVFVVPKRDHDATQGTLLKMSSTLRVATAAHDPLLRSPPEQGPRSGRRARVRFASAPLGARQTPVKPSMDVDPLLKLAGDLQ